MKSFEQFFVSPDAKIVEAIARINETGRQIVVVVDENHKILGVISDGDIRRYILKGQSLEAKVTEVMNTDPVVFEKGKPTVPPPEAHTKRIYQFPVVDENKVVVDMVFFDLARKRRDNQVIIMAGGLGSRLGELTEKTPKPMLKVGGRPILETIITRFANQGFHNFEIAVNHQGDIIKEYFQNGSAFGVNINYVNEAKRLGTAGALRLVDVSADRPAIVMNGDVLTNVNFDNMLDFHFENNAEATMCVREVEFQVQYGVVNVDNNKITHIDEKPTQRLFVNAGIYILEKKVIDFVPEDEFFDMTSLFDLLLKKDKSTCAFPIHEYWLDIGLPDQYSRAQREFKRNFPEE